MPGLLVPKRISDKIYSLGHALLFCNQVSEIKDECDIKLICHSGL